MPILLSGIAAAISSGLGGIGMGPETSFGMEFLTIGTAFAGAAAPPPGAETSFSIDIALRNLSTSFGSLVTLIRALSYIIGLTLIVRGVMMYRIFASQTLSSAQRGEIAGPLVFLLVGAFLLYFPSTLRSSLITVFGDNNISAASDLIAYESLSGVEKWQALSEVVVKYLYLIGLIAFVRGWVILSKMGHAGAQPGSLGKGIIHVIGGVFLINIVKTFNILATTLGYTGGS